MLGESGGQRSGLIKATSNVGAGGLGNSHVNQVDRPELASATELRELQLFTTHSPSPLCNLQLAQLFILKFGTMHSFFFFNLNKNLKNLKKGTGGFIWVLLSFLWHTEYGPSFYKRLQEESQQRKCQECGSGSSSWVRRISRWWTRTPR